MASAPRRCPSPGGIWPLPRCNKGKFASNLLDIGRAMVKPAGARIALVEYAYHDPPYRTGALGGKAAVRGATWPGRPLLGLGPWAPPAAPTPPGPSRRHRLICSQLQRRTAI